MQVQIAFASVLLTSHCTFFVLLQHWHSGCHQPCLQPVQGPPWPDSGLQHLPAARLQDRSAEQRDNQPDTTGSGNHLSQHCSISTQTSSHRLGENLWYIYTLQPRYNAVHYNADSDITLFRAIRWRVSFWVLLVHLHTLEGDIFSRSGLRHLTGFSILQVKVLHHIKYVY